MIKCNNHVAVTDNGVSIFIWKAFSLLIGVICSFMKIVFVLLSTFYEYRFRFIVSKFANYSSIFAITSVVWSITVRPFNVLIVIEKSLSLAIFKMTSFVDSSGSS